MTENTIKTRIKPIFIIIFAVIGIALLSSGIYTVYQLKKLSAPPAQPSQPEIDMYKIVPDFCEDCFNIEIVEQFIKEKANAKIINTKTLSIQTSEAKEFIKKYNLTKLPAVVLTGEIEKITLPPFQKRENALVFDQTPPPYFDVQTAKVKGKITATIIRAENCEKCTDLANIVTQLKQIGVFVINKTLSSEEKTAKELLQKYKLKKVPALLLSKEASEYQIINAAWNNLGTIEQDGTYVLRTIIPPYKDIKTGIIKNEPTITLLTDKSCTTCYNVTILKDLITSNFGMTFEKQESIDISSKDGIKLLTKYKINKVPTVMLSPEATEYPNFKEAWKKVGEEINGQFVFKQLNLLEGMKYKDLKTKTIITANNTQAQN